MFFIMGINQKREQLDFKQMDTCAACGRLGRYEVYMTYSYFSLFFIPLFKWNKHYFLRSTCCGAEAELSEETGRRIERGELTRIPEEEISFSRRGSSRRRCFNCGYETQEDFSYCPLCGHPMDR